VTASAEDGRGGHVTRKSAQRACNLPTDTCELSTEGRGRGLQGPDDAGSLDAESTDQSTSLPHDPTTNLTHGSDEGLYSTDESTSKTSQEGDEGSNE